MTSLDRLGFLPAFQRFEILQVSIDVRILAPVVEALDDFCHKKHHEVSATELAAHQVIFVFQLVIQLRKDLFAFGTGVAREENEFGGLSLHEDLK